MSANQWVLDRRRVADKGADAQYIAPIVDAGELQPDNVCQMTWPADADLHQIIWFVPPAM